jgi:carboxylesterase
MGHVWPGMGLIRSRCAASIGWTGTKTFWTASPYCAPAAAKRKVFAVGLSMGGLLSLRVGAAGLVDGVAALAAPLEVESRLVPFAWLIKYAKRAYVKADWPSDLDRRVREAQREAERPDYGRGDYGVTPTASVAQLYALMGDVRRHLSEITVPLLLVYSKGDRTVPYRNMALVAQQVRSTDLVTQTLEKSDHCLTQDIERETVYAWVWNFLSTRLD